MIIIKKTKKQQTLPKLPNFRDELLLYIDLLELNFILDANNQDEDISLSKYVSE